MEVNGDLLTLKGQPYETKSPTVRLVGPLAYRPVGGQLRRMPSDDGVVSQPIEAGALAGRIDIQHPRGGCGLIGDNTDSPPIDASPTLVRTYYHTRDLRAKSRCTSRNSPPSTT